MDKRLESIKKNRKCKKLPVTATAQELLDAHKVKMAAKKIMRQRMYEQMSGPSFAQANLSADHKDRGMSPVEHENSKRQHVL